MTVLFTNNAVTTLATGINNVVTSIVLTAGHGARLPAPTGSDYFYATLVDAANNIEIVKCTARTADTLTVVRGVDGTTARAYLALDRLELRPTAGGFADIQADSAAALVTATAATVTAAAALAAGNASGQMNIAGLTLSNTVGYLTTRITVAAGQCRNSLNTADLILAAPMTKDLTVAWLAGTNQGGRDTGALANAQTWHVFLISTAGGVTVDVLFSQSATAPTLPATYTLFRRLGSIVLDLTATTIREFDQTDDWFGFKLRSTDWSATANGAGPYYRQIVVPDGVRVRAKMYYQSTGTADGNAYLSGVYDPHYGVPPAYGATTQWAFVRRLTFYQHPGTWTSYVTTVIEQWTDNARGVYTYSNDSADVIAGGVLGWYDHRDQ